MKIELSRTLKVLLIFEELTLFMGSLILFELTTTYSFWLFALLFFLPDVSFSAYLINKQIGSIAYNILHHKGIMIAVIFTGYFIEVEWLLTVGIIFLGHAAFDRIFGYGLKFSDDFKHTHLGWIGN
ncbi:DUF4260 family protein [Gracilimonas sp. Q87]|uniref:DUF4260 family protein n=1 Tax=Gracilimonas sp. Q87 TaxID=3384766 RepID=UPI0039844B14